MPAVARITSATSTSSSTTPRSLRKWRSRQRIDARPDCAAVGQKPCVVRGAWCSGSDCLCPSGAQLKHQICFSRHVECCQCEATHTENHSEHREHDEQLDECDTPRTTYHVPRTHLRRPQRVHSLQQRGRRKRDHATECDDQCRFQCRDERSQTALGFLCSQVSGAERHFGDASARFADDDELQRAGAQRVFPFERRCECCALYHALTRAHQAVCDRQVTCGLASRIQRRQERQTSPQHAAECPHHAGGGKGPPDGT